MINLPRGQVTADEFLKQMAANWRENIKEQGLTAAVSLLQITAHQIDGIAQGLESLHTPDPYEFRGLSENSAELMDAWAILTKVRHALDGIAQDPGVR